MASSSQRLELLGGHLATSRFQHQAVAASAAAAAAAGTLPEWREAQDRKEQRRKMLETEVKELTAANSAPFKRLRRLSGEAAPNRSQDLEAVPSGPPGPALAAPAPAATADKLCFSPNGDLLESPGQADLVITRPQLKAAAEKWGAGQPNGQTFTDWSSMRWNAEEATLYARCELHAGCRGRFRFSLTPGEAGKVAFKPHSIEHPHAAVPAVAREAEHPVLRCDMRMAREFAATPNTSGQRKRPLEIQMSVMEATGRCLPGRAAQKIARNRVPVRPPDFGIEDMTQWCEGRHVQLGEGFTPPLNPDKFSVLWYEVRGDYGAMALAFFPLLDLLLRTYIDDASSRGEAIQSFMAQCDYTGEIFWHGYKLGIIGFPI